LAEVEDEVRRWGTREYALEILKSMGTKIEPTEELIDVGRRACGRAEVRERLGNSTG
jgi:hypothetical protein